MSNQIKFKKGEETSSKTSFSSPTASSEKVTLPPIISVREFANKINCSVAEVISKLMHYGVLATINEAIDFETAQIIASDFNIEVLPEKTVKKEEEISDTSALKPRPPVVAVMGHVDHGKTTLLDYIRKTKVAKQEAGGITQHIGAYQINWQTKDGQKRKITFLDTPGHEAFVSIRERGASLTDFIILVIAADDGVKPQTIEVINLARESNTPLIVAINKTDLPNADVERVKRELADQEIVPEEWGGKVPIVEISALKGTGIDNLLDIVLLMADLKELKANPNLPAVGTVIESKKDSRKGAVATVLVQNGTLRSNSNVVIGSVFGKIRFLENEWGRRLDEAPPGTPVVVGGLSGVPEVGEILTEVPSLAEAKKIASESARAKSVKSLKGIKGKNLLEIALGTDKETKELHLIIKADVLGSLETIKRLIEKFSQKGVEIKIVKEGVGDITESDILLGETAEAFILGFKVKLASNLKQLAESKKVGVSLYEVIYNLEEDLKKTILAFLPPEIIETTIGEAKVIKIFRIDKKESIVGVRVVSGKLEVGAKIKIVRDKKEIGRTEILSLKREKSEIKEALSGTEAGVGLPGRLPLEEGDTLEAYTLEEKQKEFI